MNLSNEKNSTRIIQYYTKQSTLPILAKTTLLLHASHPTCPNSTTHHNHRERERVCVCVCTLSPTQTSSLSLLPP